MNYCIWCHNQGKDSCAKGFKDKKTGAFQKSAFKVTLAGCPLEEKISEMHTLKARGVALGALAMIVTDNPMVAGNRHRLARFDAIDQRRETRLRLCQGDLRHDHHYGHPCFGVASGAAGSYCYRSCCSR